MAYNKRAGKSTREMANRRRQSALWIGIIGIVVLIVISLFIQNAKVFGIGGVGILVLLIFMSVFRNLIEGQVDRKIKLEKRAIRGAKAEEKIGELFTKLSADYSVLNDVKSPFGNIDHIVIGKNSGVFLIETKAHGGRVETDGETILVNGKMPEKDFIAQALQNSYWLRDKISEITGSKPWITPIVVFTNAFVTPTRPIKGVNIVNKKYLLNMLRRSNRPNAVLAQVWENKEKIESKLM
jgi:hypothetical protein